LVAVDRDGAIMENTLELEFILGEELGGGRFASTHGS
jgi:hypothetical protein